MLWNDERQCCENVPVLFLILFLYGGEIVFRCYNLDVLECWKSCNKSIKRSVNA